MPETHVRLVKLNKRFPNASAAAVDDIDLEIPRGSLTTLLGPSGCGKTTTLRMIAGFYEPDAGDIFIGSRRVNDVPVHRRRTAMVFQDYALFPHMNVEDNVGYVLKLGVSIRTELISIQRQLGITTIYVTHDQDEALAMSDWVAVMNEGRVIQWGTPWQVYYAPRTPFMADFLGSVNLVRVPVVERSGSHTVVRLGEHALSLPGSLDGEEALLSI